MVRKLTIIGKVTHFHYKQLIDEADFDFGLSLVSTLEYWRYASGSPTAKVYNQKDSSFGKDKFEDLVGSLSFPISKNFNTKFTLIVPRFLFCREIRYKRSRENAYGNNFYIGSGIIFGLVKDLNFIFSYTTPLGPK